ncbi:benzoate 4-monooxygenase cytochrome P450 [Aspergillus avenaceus]|uniref:Benzoate 4-monooxygenase cytochrome P450 n=1 Tax=Aspergillus avenaceus TaxID=36643 RepID=A0A5N6U5A3_ASPAV|nr:benzoate 4-monooxygenase cytochrome P450 [Aspergillus avenaceus]
MAAISTMMISESSAILPWLPLILITVPLWMVLYNVWLHPLRRYPGPPLAVSSPLYYYYMLYRGTLHSTIKDFHDKYGDVLRISPGRLVYRNAEAWKEICGHRKAGAAPFTKDEEFYAETPSGHNILTTPNEADHSRYRRQLSHAFSDRAMKEQEPLLQSYVDLLIERLRQYSSQEPVDMTRWYNFATFDIIGDLAFGEPFKCLQDSHYHPYVTTVFRSVKGTHLMRPFLVLPKALLKLAVPRSLQKAMEGNYRLTSEKVIRRLELETSRPDFITYILKHNDEKGLRLSEIKANASILIIAGSETTATLLSGCTFYLMKNPACYKRLVEEIRGAFNQESEINIHSIAKLQYLHAVLEESLRVYPPVPAILPRTVPKGGAFINGRHVPEGTSVSMAYFSAFRAKSNFVDPDSFIPERWLENRDPRFEFDKREALQPFSYGPRNCLGKNLAYTEMRLIMTRILWNFDLSLEPSCHDWANQLSFTVWEKKPLMINLIPVQ